MSNAILNSNASSALISSLDSVSSAKNPYIYSYSQRGTLGAAHVPAHSRTVVTSYSNSVGFNQNCDFQVIKAGMWESGWLKFQVTTPAANTEVNASLMNLMVEEIQLLTAGKVVCSSKPFGRAAIMSNKPYQIKKNLEKCYALEGAYKTHSGVTTVTAYIPLSFSCFDAPELNYNTSFVEPLVVRVRLAAANTYASNNADPAVAVSLESPVLELIQVHRLLPSNLEQKQIAENYADTESLVRVQYDLVEELKTETLAASANQKIARTLTTNRTFNKMFIAVEDTQIAATTDLDSGALGQYKQLSNIKITGNGQTIMDCDADLVRFCLNQDTDSANAAFSVGNGFEEGIAHSCFIYCVDFGMNKDPSHLTNVISSREINDLKVEVTLHGTPTATPHNLRLCLQSPQLESLHSASGKISTSLSS